MHIIILGSIWGVGGLHTSRHIVAILDCSDAIWSFIMTTFLFYRLSLLIIATMLMCQVLLQCPYNNHMLFSYPLMIKLYQW